MLLIVLPPDADRLIVGKPQSPVVKISDFSQWISLKEVRDLAGGEVGGLVT